MAHINSSFSSPYAGVLEVTLRGDFLQGTRRDAGFPAGASNLLLRGKVGASGVYYVTPGIDRNAPSTFMRCNYPGGNAVWTVQTEEVARYFGGGTSAYGFQNLELYLALIKR